MRYFRMKYQNLTKNNPKLDEVAILLKRSNGSPNSAFNLREVSELMNFYSLLKSSENPCARDSGTGVF